MKKTDVVLGIDIGGTNTAFGLVDANGKCLLKDKIKTQSHKPVERFCERLFAQLKFRQNQMDPLFSIKGIGVGAPNANYYNGLIEDPPNLGWETVDIKQYFGPYTTAPIVITNDANAAALGELYFGAAREMKDFIEITLGTGLGSGIVVNGELLYGSNGSAGEMGHVIVFPGGRQCSCGRKGCLETYVSAEGIKKTMLEYLEEAPGASVLSAIEPAKLSSKMIAQAAQQGDALALKAFDFTGTVLGRAAADAAAYFSPQAFVLFGGLAQAGELLFKPMRASFEKHVINTLKGVIKIIPSALKDDDAAVLGAASLAWHELAQDN